jgi:hypothetical protein
MNILNETHIEGILYDQKLVLKTAGENSKNPGMQFISGTIDIATDDELTNIVQVHFTYETPTFSRSGQANSRYNTLFDIMNGVTKVYMRDGQGATIRVDSALALNEFYSNRSGQEELVSVKRNEGGFIHVNSALNSDPDKRNTFRCDILITNVRRVEANEERKIDEHVVVKGYVFDFRKTPMPMEFNAYTMGAMDYFEALEASEKNPVFTRIWGNQITQTTASTITEESAFGETFVREVASNRKDFVITGAAKEPYVWDDESTMTAAQLKEGLANRELNLANMKQRSAEYQASRNTNTAPTATTARPNATGFNF